MDNPQEMTLKEYSLICEEIENQPVWRSTADREMDYADGNQLDSNLLREQAALGIPPAIEDLIGPALLSIQGYEATIRTDWRVSSDGDPGSQDVADAINYKLNKAERASGADRACSEAFRPQVGCGLGWVEVSRESDPFLFPYRCLAVHRNEIHWDMKAQRSDLSDARWLRRSRWVLPERLADVFPEHAELIALAGRSGGQVWLDEAFSNDGGVSTGLENAWHEGRAWTVQEDRWFNPTTKEVCVSELWYRRWVKGIAVKRADGRVVEYEPENPEHDLWLATGEAKAIRATFAKLRRSFWLGPYRLHDDETPYPHRDFPYVPFFGFREDVTGVPYGYVRGMKYPQDSLNSGISKLRWGMAVVRVERTKGAVMMSDEQMRRQVSRRDSDIILDANHMNQPGARFEVKRDYQLTDQHYQMLAENRAAIERVSNITSGFMGRVGNATSGIQEQTQVEQSNQSLAKVMDNFRAARSQIGRILMALIIEDMGKEPQTIIIEGDAVNADRAVSINQTEMDASGHPVVSNDISQIALSVALDDVPSTNSYRAQQLNALSEAVKSLPADYQAAMIPFLVSLMDVPFKKKVVDAVREVEQRSSPEEIKRQTDEAVKDALAKSGNDLKARELDMKERLAQSEIKGVDAKTVLTLIQAMYSSMQGGAQVATMPAIAPIADAMMMSAGYQSPQPAGDDPNFPTPSEAAAMDIRHPYVQGEGAQPGSEQIPPARENTSPELPPVPASPMTGIETARTSDNV